MRRRAHDGEGRCGVLTRRVGGSVNVVTQAEQALEASRDELSNLREDMANVEQVKAKAQVPLKVGSE